MTENHSLRPGDDGLKCDENARKSPLEVRLESRPIAERPRLGRSFLERAALEHRKPVHGSRLAHRARELRHLRWFLQVAKGPVLDRGHGVLEARTPGEDDHGNVEIDVSDLPQEVDAVGTGHQHVRDDGVEAPPAAKQREPSVGARYGLHREAVPLQHLR